MINEASEYNELLDIVSDIVNAGHMDQEGLARLRAHLGYKPAALTTQRQAEPEANIFTSQTRVERLEEALRELMNWQVKNVHVWNNSAYDNAARVLTSAADEVTDAQRYRWLRDKSPAQWTLEVDDLPLFKFDLDAAIDAAMQKETK